MRGVRPFVLLCAVVVLAGCTGGLVPDDTAEPSATELSFTEVSADTGFEYASSDSGIGNGNDSVYVADYDNDLRSDALVLGGSEPVLFRNAGDEFERTGALPPVTGEIQSALFLDHDNDGWADLLLFRSNDTPVLFENRDGTFHRSDAGFEDDLTFPVGASAADYTGDGCLDVFVAQYADWQDRRPRGWQTTLQFEEDNGNPNVLYRGDCDGFERVENAGIEGSHWSMATSFVDLTGDGLPDIHVANDYYNDTVYYNDGDGTFTHEYLAEETDRNGMSSEVANLDGDGHLDVFVTNIFFPRDLSELNDREREIFNDFVQHRLGKGAAGNNVLLGEDDGFEYAGDRLGLDEGGWGWAAIVSDFDSDGERDVFHTTQTVMTFNRSDPVYPYSMLWVQRDGEFYRQDADDIGFERTDGRGAGHLDFDADGAPDVAVATYDDEFRLYRNDAEQGNSLQVGVESGDLEHTSIGARVYATVDGETQYQVNNAGADYQSQDSRFLHFGVGEAETIDELRIVWPDGTELTLQDVSTGERILVTPEGIERGVDYDEV